MSDNLDVTRSWFATLCNPEEHGYFGTPQEICERLRDEWIAGSATRTGAWAYCISADGLHHLHMALEDVKPMRFSAVKKSYAVGAHLEPTKGGKKQAEDYIYKRPPYEEKGEQVICVVQHGEIRGNSSARSDFTIIETMIAEGFTPHQILDCNFAFRRYTKEIREAYFRKRFKETPPFREVKVHYIVGASGSGKSHTYVDLCKSQGEDAIYMVSDYSTNGGFDLYNGEPILFMDELKSQLRYDTLLSILDGYKKQLHARYSNIWMLWNDVRISTVYPPEELYDLMVPEDRQFTDTYTQLKRRITDITYCWTDGTDYHRYTIPMSAYKDYISLQIAAKRSIVAETAPIPSLFDET